MASNKSGKIGKGKVRCTASDQNSNLSLLLVNRYFIVKNQEIEIEFMVVTSRTKTRHC